MVLGAAESEAARAFIEIGTVALVLAALARLAGRLGVTTIPFYLLAGLAVGKGGIAPLDVSADFIRLVAEIGVLLLLLTLGLEYTADELRHGLRTGLVPGATDAVVNFIPGLLAGLALGWDPKAAVLLGGVSWVSSSGIIAKVLADLDRLANRETPSILNLLVIEDLAMAVYLPVAAALAAGRGVPQRRRGRCAGRERRAEFLRDRGTPSQTSPSPHRMSCWLRSLGRLRPSGSVQRSPSLARTIRFASFNASRPSTGFRTEERK